MTEFIHREAAASPQAFSGERLTAAISGQVEIEHYHRYLLAREFCRDRDVLDVAAGEGYGTALLAQIARSAVGIEIDDATVNAARAAFQRPNLRYEQGDARSLALPDASIDVAISFETLEHLAEQDAFLAELRRVLRPGGLLIISTPDRDIYAAPGTPPNPFHVLELSRPEFESLLARHFAHVGCAGQRALIGSVILSPRSDGGMFSYEKRGDAMIMGETSLAGAPYLIAFASNEPIPALPNSVYVYRGDIDTDPQTRREAELALNDADRASVAANARANAAEAQIANITARLVGIEASTIWRATRPLRTFGQSFPFITRNLRRLAKLAWWTVTLKLPSRYVAWRKNQQPNRAYQRSWLERLTPVRTLHAADITVPTADNPAISIIIATYGQLQFTLACLKSIADHPPARPIEVIVVDDAYPGPESMASLNDISGITLIRNSKNLGFLLSCNHAATHAKGKYIYLLNNDTEVLTGSIDTLADLLDRRPDAGLAGSKLLFPNRRLQEAGGIMWDDASGWNYGRGHDPARPEYNYVREVDYCSGASIMLRRDLFESLRGFDPAFAPAYYEDTDLAFRIRARGLKVLFEPRSVVIHHEGASHGTDTTQGVKANQITNKALMQERWGGVLARENYPNGQHILRARDRARHRMVILVIDHYVPEPDRDAGSRSILGIMDSLLDAGWVVKFWPQNRAYSQGYTTALEQRGIEVLDHRYPGDLTVWLRENGAALDHLLVVRPTMAMEVLPHIIANHTSMLSFYGVDLHFARMERQADLDNNLALREAAAKMKQLERRVWQYFDLVIYPSQEEAETVCQIAPRTLARGIVPFWFEIGAARLVPPPGHIVLFVAGFAHPPNVDAAVFLIREILPRLRQAVGPVQIILAGSSPTDTVCALAGPDVEVTGYVTDEALAQVYQRARAAVVPLRFGAGVKGKVVESLSHGLPLVTTSIGVQGIPGLADILPVHDDARGLATALALLLTDDTVWCAQSASQTAFARAHFSRDAMRASVLAAFDAGSVAIGLVP